MSVLPNEAVPPALVPFKGCIRQFYINSVKVALTTKRIRSARNLEDCDGTPCGGDFCENGGTCWLDPNLNAHCSCTEPYYGDRCELVPSCEERACQNSGKCTDERCACLIGWIGAFCETSVVITALKFSGDGYLNLAKTSEKKRELNYFGITSIAFKFTTASDNGLILWTQKVYCPCCFNESYNLT